MTGPLILKNNPAEDLEAATKQYVDNHTSDVVFYTPQTLTDEQKAQARGNINSAPGGFGLGAIWNQAPENDANQIPGTGWFVAHQNTPTGGWWIIQDIFDGSVHYQFAFAKRSSSGVLGGTIVQRNKQEQNDWGPWEWVNPPMGLGTEYRTTERYFSKPVYVKTINMGNLPGNVVKQASFQSNNVVDKIVSVTGQCTSDSGVNISLPYHAGSAPNWNTVILIGATGVGTAQIVTFNEEFAGYTDARITVKYTKLVD